MDEKWVNECAGEVSDDYSLEFCEGDVATVHNPKRYEDDSAIFVWIMSMTSYLRGKGRRLTRASSYHEPKHPTT